MEGLLILQFGVGKIFIPAIHDVLTVGLYGPHKLSHVSVKKEVE